MKNVSGDLSTTTIHAEILETVKSVFIRKFSHLFLPLETISIFFIFGQKELVYLAKKKNKKYNENF